MIRSALATDAQAMADIYNPFILGTTITFEEEAVTPQEMASRIGIVLLALPWLVIEVQGTVAGYAYATPWKTRSAYRRTVESAIYMAPSQDGQGLGTRLYEALLGELQQLGVHAVLGGIALPNEASVALHERLGFEKVGQLQQVGWKLQRWVDVGYWEKRL
ncbi:MAG TPA: arsinothricin resistance N-acetyltransferase ArsN1 family B [Geothrix sp.]